jgi:hypothetical protein
MSTKATFDLGLRAYGLGVGILGIFTVLLAFGYVTISTTLFGGVWLGAAALGGALVLGLTVNRDQVIETDRSQARCQRWEKCMFTGWLLNIYLIAAAIWCGVSFGWYVGGQSVSGLPVVGYGWFAVAIYGAVVAAGIIATHSEYVAEAVDPTASIET